MFLWEIVKGEFYNGFNGRRIYASANELYLGYVISLYDYSEFDNFLVSLGTVREDGRIENERFFKIFKPIQFGITPTDSSIEWAMSLMKERVASDYAEKVAQKLRGENVLVDNGDDPLPFYDPLKQMAFQPK